MYKLIDLFAGAGGLSLGFIQTGQFEIVMAAENNPNAKTTYEHNHNVKHIESDVRNIDYKEIRKKYGPIDVVIGGPPCQGFSNANRQRAIISMNNGLVKEYYRAIKELKPAMFVMENVSSIQSDTHRFYCTIGEAETIKELGIRCRREEIVLAKSFPALSGILDTVKSAFQNYTDYLWNDKLFHVADVLYKRIGNKAKFMYSYEKYKKYVRNHLKKNPPTKPEDGIGDIYQAFYDSLMIDYEDYDATESLRLNIDTAVKIQRMFRKYKELIDNNIEIEGYSYEKGISAKVKSYSVLDYIDNIVHSDDFPYEIMKGTLNALDFGAPQKRERFIIIGSRIGNKPDFPDGQFGQTLPIRTVKDAIADLEDEKPSKEPIENGVLRKKPYIHENQPLHELRDSDILFNHFNTVTGEIAQKRFDELKEGGNFHTLPDTLKETYSDGKRTQSTIYLKLKYSEPCGTVVNVRKSMWVHPTKNRSLSVREAARLQTFPDHFRFFGTKDSQFQQVGNAVPPILAKAIAEKVVDYLEANGKQETRERILLEIMLDNSFTEMEIAKRLNVSQATVSHHLIRFEAEGIVKRTQEGKRHVWHYVPKADRNNSVDITIPAV